MPARPLPPVVRPRTPPACPAATARRSRTRRPRSRVALAVPLAAITIAITIAIAALVPSSRADDDSPTVSADRRPPSADEAPLRDVVSPCEDTEPVPEACAADVDGDGVPDHRDVCLPTDSGSGPPAALSHVSSGTGGTGGTGGGAFRTDVLGCPVPAYDARPIRVLDGIAFPVGRSDLDVTARELLDRVAGALGHVGAGTWEIAAHTDGAGSRARNLRLSETRAKAVRHYLMLRGIGPNRVRARGYGETRPIGDDRTADGRRANRRIEIERID